MRRIKDISMALVWTYVGVTSVVGLWKLATEALDALEERYGKKK